MKRWSLGLLVFVTVVLAGCGGGNSNAAGNLNGNWTASLMSSSNNSAPVFAFTTNLTQSSGTSVNVANFNFTTSSPCFVSQQTATGGFVLSGNFNGNVTGTFQMAIQSGTPSGNTLTLQGSVNNNAISGTWVLSGITAGCTGSGSFTMTKM